MSDRRQGFGGRARTILRVGALLLVAMLLRALPAATAAGSYDANDAVQAAEYSSARHLGVQAFLYGYPLLDLDRVFKTGTSATVPNGSGGGPVNEFSHFRRFTIPSDTTVVAPSHDTFYSIAWLDLVPQPSSGTGPTSAADSSSSSSSTVQRGVRADRLRRPSERRLRRGPAGLARALAARDQSTPLPVHARLDIGRTYIKDAADTPNVVRLQNEYSLTPLNRWGTNYRPRRPKRIIKTVTQYTIPDPLLSKLNRVGIGPGLHPSADPRLDAATRQGLSDSVAVGHKRSGRTSRPRSSWARPSTTGGSCRRPARTEPGSPVSGEGVLVADPV